MKSTSNNGENGRIYHYGSLATVGNVTFYNMGADNANSGTVEGKRVYKETQNDISHGGELFVGYEENDFTNPPESIL